MTSLANPFKTLPFMGVIRVNEAAARGHGYVMGDPSWSNFGQGQPEVGPLPGAPPRPARIEFDPDDHAYGPVEGLDELREAVAAHYNRLYRQGKASQYTAENVAIAPGGRVALSRCGAALDDLRLGYFTPDYTAYEDLLCTFHRLSPTRIELAPEDGFRITPDALARRVAADGIGALLISNPCNPTGVVIRGDELAAWIELARQRGCALLMDEFYSHYIYDGQGPVSAAAHVDDVEKDPVVIFDGLTKCFRYPGWRVGWVVASKAIIRTLTAAGSFLDGGPSRPIQRAATAVLEPGRADQETDVVRTVFAEKQALMREGLEAIGVRFPHDPQSTFYLFGSVADLPAPLNTGTGFMETAFRHQVLTVPGDYFDVNPERVHTPDCPLNSWVRFSFGPPRDNIVAGLSRLAEMVAAAR
jgi:aspartate/methionine/tyrosine aminotransferase